MSLIETVRVSSGEGAERVEALAVITGRDVVVTVGGGPAPHIGAVALGVPRPSLKDPTQVSASVSVLCVTGHKEDALARDLAHRFASAWNTTVCVTAGIHLDDATPEDISRFLSRVASVMDELQDRVEGARAMP